VGHKRGKKRIAATLYREVTMTGELSHKGYNKEGKAWTLLLYLGVTMTRKPVIRGTRKKEMHGRYTLPGGDHDQKASLVGHESGKTFPEVTMTEEVSHKGYKNGRKCIAAATLRR
jgi:hypothetical protein